MKGHLRLAVLLAAICVLSLSLASNHAGHVAHHQHANFHSRSVHSIRPLNTSSIEEARRRVAQGQAAMAQANAEILSRPPKNRHEVLDTQEIKEMRQDPPVLKYESEDTSGHKSQKRSKSNLTDPEWSSYKIPQELKKAARIMAEAQPLDLSKKPNVRSIRQNSTARYNAKFYEGPDTNVMAPVLQKPDGLDEVVQQPPSYFRFSDNLTSTEPNITQKESPLTRLDKRASPEWWMAELHQRGSAPYAPNGYKVWRNVKDYGAVGDGRTDDTDAINLAMSDGGRCGAGCNSSTVYPATVYFPPGDYLVSSPIVQYYNTEMLGSPLDPPVIVAAESFIGLGIITSDVYTGTKSQWYLNTANFLRSIRNFYIDIRWTPSDAQVCGIHWQVSQATSLQEIGFYAEQSYDTTQQGIYMENGSGGFLANLYFNGGKYGAYMGNQQFTARALTFEYVYDTAIQIHWDWGWTMQNIYMNNVGTGFKIIGGQGGPLSDGQGVGSIILTDVICEVSNTLVDTTLVADNSTAFLLQNALTYDVDVLVQDSGKGRVLLSGDGQSAEELIYTKSWGFGKLSNSTGNVGFVNGGPVLTADRVKSLTVAPPIPDYMDTRYYFTRRRPGYYDLAGSDFIDVKAYGAKGDGKTNDAPVLNHVFSLAANMSAVVYIPYGVYILEDTVTVPVGSRIIGQTWPQLMASGKRFQNMQKPRPVIKVGEPGNQGVIEMQTLMFTTRGPTAGAVLVQWNVKESTQGSAGIWDCHFRVGGAIGSELSVQNCPKLTGKINPDCIAASLLFHITRDASAYIENVWSWTADHDLDDAETEQIDVYTGRGILIESQGPTWLWGTSSEHSVLYQYQLSGARDVMMGLVQTEAPYFQPRPKAPAPFTQQIGAFADDPDFRETGSDGFSWAMRIIDTSTVYILNTGFYTWFQSYDQTCINNNKRDCQKKTFYTEESFDVWVYNLVTIGSVEMISPLNGIPILAKANRNGYAASILAWLGGANQTTGKRHFDGYRIYEPETLDTFYSFTDTCKAALSAVIKCDAHTLSFSQPQFYGILGNQTFTDQVCDSGCRGSVDHWVSNVRKFCKDQEWSNGARAEVMGGQIQFGLNSTCQKSKEAPSEYCNNVFQDLPSVNSIEDLAEEDLCSSCQVGRLQMMQASPYSIYANSPEHQAALKLVQLKCGLTGPTEPQKPVIPLPSPQTGFCVSDTLHTTSKGDTCDSLALKYNVSSAAIFSSHPDITSCSNITSGVDICMPLACKTYEIQTGDDCFTIAATNDIQEQELLRYNSWIAPGCHNLQSAAETLGNVLCVSAPGGQYRGVSDELASPLNPAQSQFATSKVAPPKGAEPAQGTTSECGLWHVAAARDTCASIATRNITSELLVLVNPSLSSSSCDSKIVEGRAYCVRPLHHWAANQNKLLDNYHSYGCYGVVNNGKLPLTANELTNNRNMTVKLCGAYCLWQSTGYWALRNGTDCACGSKLALDAFKTNSSSCSDGICAGDSKMGCGGSSSFSIYGFPEELKRDFVAVGCYRSSSGSTQDVLSYSPGGNSTSAAMTTELCDSQCLSSDYFGLANGQECYCGSKITSKAQLSSQSKCDKACAGDSSDVCGARGFVQVYSRFSEKARKTMDK